MTVEERFERIENGFLQLQQLARTNHELLQGVLDAQASNQAMLAGNQALLKIVLESETRTQESLRGLNEAIGRYVDAAEARMRRIEENLDALIRAITSEHGNGKGNR